MDTKTNLNVTAHNRDRMHAFQANLKALEAEMQPGGGKKPEGAMTPPLGSGAREEESAPTAAEQVHPGKELGVMGYDYSFALENSPRERKASEKVMDTLVMGATAVVSGPIAKLMHAFPKWALLPFNLEGRTTPLEDRLALKHGYQSVRREKVADFAPHAGNSVLVLEAVYENVSDTD